MEKGETKENEKKSRGKEETGRRRGQRKEGNSRGKETFEFKMQGIGTIEQRRSPEGRRGTEGNRNTGGGAERERKRGDKTVHSGSSKISARCALSPC